MPDAAGVAGSGASVSAAPSITDEGASDVAWSVAGAVVAAGDPGGSCGAAGETRGGSVTTATFPVLDGRSSIKMLRFSARTAHKR